MSLFNEYLSLRDEIDLLAEKLFQQHQPQVMCQKGCDHCCMDFAIFPVEFYYLQEQLKQKPLSFNSSKDDESCIFLKNHVCSVYEHRPVICRTHGLPLLFLNNETEEWELSVCELNFTNFNDFDADNTFPQDTFNSRLFMINAQFIQSKKYSNYSKFDLIPICDLRLTIQDNPPIIPQTS